MIKILAKLSTIVFNQVNNVAKLLPRQCLLCKSVSYSRNICDYCNLSLPRLVKKCKNCAWPITVDRDSCNLCIDYLGEICDINIQIVFPYIHPIDKLIKKFKYQGDLSVGKLFAELLLEYFIKNNYDHREYDAIIPVPIHKSKLQMRGFNQGIELARYLSKKLNIKADYNLIAKYRATNSQMGGDKADRGKNIKDSFCFNYKPKYNSVILVDDVVTTGSTILEIINLLYSTNIRKIMILAVARRL